MVHLSPMKSWKLMGPLVVSASKLGAVDPRRRLAVMLENSSLALKGNNSLLTWVVPEPLCCSIRRLCLITELGIYRIWRMKTKK